MNRPCPRNTPAFVSLLACLPLALLATTAAAQDFSDDARFEVRLSAFNPEANIRFDGTGVATTASARRNWRRRAASIPMAAGGRAASLPSPCRRGSRCA